MVLANILGPDALIIVVLAVVLLFGAGQLPKFARSVGEASKEFKKIQDDPNDGNRSTPAGTPVVIPNAIESGVASDGAVQLSKSELDALLAEREARARAHAQDPSKS